MHCFVTVGRLSISASLYRGDDGVCQCLEDGGKNPAWSAADANEAQVSVLGERIIFVFPDSITLMSFDAAMYVTR